MILILIWPGIAAFGDEFVVTPIQPPSACRHAWLPACIAV
jgi:hypothetical protein